MKNRNFCSNQQELYYENEWLFELYCVYEYFFEFYCI